MIFRGFIIILAFILFSSGKCYLNQFSHNPKINYEFYKKTLNNSANRFETNNFLGTNAVGYGIKLIDKRSLPSQNLPEFSKPLPNITVLVGQDAVLPCAVKNLRGTGYKVNFQSQVNTFAMYLKSLIYILLWLV